MSNHKVNLREKLERIDQPWTPKIVGELNGQHVKLARFEGEFVWHQHEHEDELFLVISGELKIELQGESITLAAGEFYIVPRGSEHRPTGMPVAEVMLFEPEGTLNTGKPTNERTVRDPERI